MVARLDELRTATFDSSGTAAVTIGPNIPGVQWRITSIRLVTTSSTLRSSGSVYDGSATASPLGSTFSGDGDQAGAEITLWAGQYLTAVWSNGDTGATAQIRVTGEIRTTTDGYAEQAKSITTPFANATTVTAAATPSTLNGTRLLDVPSTAFAGLTGPTTGPIDVSQWQSLKVQVDGTGSPRTIGLLWYADRAMTILLSVTSASIDTGQFNFLVASSGPYLKITVNQFPAVASTFSATISGYRVSVVDLRQIVATSSVAMIAQVALNIGAGATNTIAAPSSSARTYGPHWYMVSSDAAGWRARLYNLDLLGAEDQTIDRFTSAAAGQRSTVLNVPAGRTRLDLTNTSGAAANFWATLAPFTHT